MNCVQYPCVSVNCHSYCCAQVICDKHWDCGAIQKREWKRAGASKKGDERGKHKIVEHLKVEQGETSLWSHQFPLEMVKPSVVRHVSASENVEVPSPEKVIASVYVDMHENQDAEKS